MTPIELGAVGLVAVLIVREFIGLLKTRGKEDREASLVNALDSLTKAFHRHMEADVRAHEAIADRLARIEVQIETYASLSERIRQLELHCASAVKKVSSR